MSRRDHIGLHRGSRVDFWRVGYGVLLVLAGLCSIAVYRGIRQGSFPFSSEQVAQPEPLEEGRSLAQGGSR
jgi:hypothetical protein